MTYCLGIRVAEGLVCLADGRVTSGNLVTNARKATLHGPQDHSIVVMTSGLRSLREKQLSYFDRYQQQQAPQGFASMLDAVIAYGKCLREVEAEDRSFLERSDLNFNLHSIVGGCLPGDRIPTLYLVYPEGNWIEVDNRTPYLSIGSIAYGKPILDRALTYETTLANALKLAYLSFDSTRYSSADVGYPVDMLTYSGEEACWRHAQYDYDQLSEQRQWWNREITALAARMPHGPWVEGLLADQSKARLALVGEDSS
ncbi:peptidase [Fodinicurvata halophila]|uniref:Peptidase n=1 Tax=Fodinicurvata halophila TaxID=1419723 RepID=A0ABV8UPJ7_9PROT